MASSLIQETNKTLIFSDMFRKRLEIAASSLQIDHRHELITIGSCFSDSIGAKLTNARFNLLSNPFGTVFHPIALVDSLSGLKTENVLERDNYYFNWQLSGTWFDTENEAFRIKVDELNFKIQDKLKSAKVVMVTFGTAWAYVHKELNRVVANCHKMPQDLFEKRLFHPAEIVEAWQPIIEKYPDINWVFTVSPVRHWKDGARENNVSKGILHQAIHELLAGGNVHYFPAYEILMDELRDYRFYSSDFLHPSDEAVDYIWMKFKETYFDASTQLLVDRIEKLERSKNHQVLYPASSESKKFEAYLRKEEEEVEKILNEFEV